MSAFRRFTSVSPPPVHVSSWHFTDPAHCWPYAAHRARFLGLSGHQKITVCRELSAGAAAVPRSLRGSCHLRALAEVTRLVPGKLRKKRRPCAEPIVQG